MRALTHVATAVLGGLTGITITLVVVGSGDPDPERRAAGVLVQVGNVPVTVAQLRTAAREHARSSCASADREKLLRELVGQAALTDYARKQGFCDEPAGQLAMRRFLAQRVKERELVPRLDRIMPSDDACRRYYERHSQEFRVPERRKLAILRLSAYAILYLKDIPASVTIDEAITLAKRYGTRESYRFVNGVLDGILKRKAG